MYSTREGGGEGRGGFLSLTPGSYRGLEMPQSDLKHREESRVRVGGFFIDILITSRTLCAGRERQGQ